MDNSIVLLLIYGFCGLLFLLIGLIFKSKYNLKVKQCTMETIGIIEDYKIRTTNSYYDSYRLWHPVIKFDVDNKQVKKEINIGTTKKKYEIGDKVIVKYNPNDINEFYIVGYNINKLGNIFIIVGTAVLFIDVILTLFI